jgi:para-nitrobenzyl esterase
MAMPAANGLFHAAATMSGQQVVASGPAHAWERTKAFLDRVKNAQGDVEALRHLPIEKLVEDWQPQTRLWADRSISGRFWT